MNKTKTEWNGMECNVGSRFMKLSLKKKKERKYDKIRWDSSNDKKIHQSIDTNCLLFIEHQK